MAQYLAELLKAKQPLFSISLKQLEKQTGKKSVDVALLGEIIEKAHDRAERLGLDATDLHGKELYHALLKQAKKHDEHLAKAIGISDPEDVAEAVDKSIETIEQVDMPRKCWALKTSVAKEFLLSMPPERIMDRLGYRSAKSMLRNEDLFEIYGALRFAEDSEWLNEFNKQYEELTPSDFETREIKLVRMPEDRWGDIASHFVKKKRHLNTHLKELGVVLILPSSIKKMPGITTKILSLTFHYYNEVRLYSSFFKLIQVKKDFGKEFVDTLIADPDKSAVMAGEYVHWRVIQRYFGKLPDEDHPEIFEPHVQPEDLHWRKAEELMYELDPELEFWKDLDYVGLMLGGETVTFNMMDVALSYSNEIPYEKRYIYHFRESLWNEIFIRYMGEQNLEDQVLRQLDNDLISPEELEVKA